MDEQNAVVLGRVTERHPELSASDVLSTWNNAIVVVERTSGWLPDAVLVAVGFDSKGRLIEAVAAIQQDGVACIFHAMTPPSRKTLKETGLAGQRS